jgi:DeoR family transcriptional regulator, ulaG and ulaABCDEF operon transcriptional repressor
MLDKERYEIILRVLKQDKFLTLKEIQNILKVSEATIRRDFSKLESDGYLKRTHGGAEIVEKEIIDFKPDELPFEYRTGFLIEKKRLIAKKAVSLCESDETITIDAGSTTFQMAQFLTAIKLQVITNSFAIAKELMKNQNIRVIVSGGIIYPDSQLILNPFDDNIFKNYYSSKVFMGVGGIDEQGLTNSDPFLIRVQRQIIEQGKNLIILADSSKFDKKGSLLLCGFEKVHTIITDNDIHGEMKDFLVSKGINLMIV